MSSQTILTTIFKFPQSPYRGLCGGLEISDHLTGELVRCIAIRCGQDQPDEYGKLVGQEVKRGVATRLPCYLRE